MAGDDTTPDAFLLKNVPRRPDVGGNPGSSVSNNASPPATAVAPSNERPSSTGAAVHDVPQTNNKKHRLVLIEETDEPEDATDRHVVAALDKAAASSPASSGSSETEPDDVDWAAENERRRRRQCRRRKGKMPVVNEDADDDLAPRRRPPASASSGLCNGKLLGDAIRSHHFRSTATAAAAVSDAGFKPPPSTKPKKPKTTKDNTSSSNNNAWFWCGTGTGRNGMTSAGSSADHSFYNLAVVSDRLRTTMAALNLTAAVPPVRVYGKLLTRCDRDAHGARLLMSFKSWRRAFGDDVVFPACALLTDPERYEVHDERPNQTGLAVTAFDRAGDAYEMRFRYLKSNEGYRIICQWSEFLNHNGLVVRKDDPAQAVDDDVMVDLWLFRSPAPEGKVGMVMLHYRRGDAPHADAALDEVEQKKLQRQLMLNNNGGDVGAGGGNDDAVMEEDVEGDANGEGGGEPPGNKVPDAPPPPPALSEPEGDCKMADEEEDGAPASAPSTSSQRHGGGGARRSDEVRAPLLSVGLGGGGTEEEEQEAAGGAVRLMLALKVEAATEASMEQVINEVAAPPSSSPEAAGGAAAMRRMTAAELAEAELQAAQGLVMLSEAGSPVDGGLLGVSSTTGF